VEDRHIQGVRRPDFEIKLVDVAGLSLDSPQRAIVFGFDEVQGLDRTGFAGGRFARSAVWRHHDP
jgi:hypothetical protein